MSRSRSDRWSQRHEARGHRKIEKISAYELGRPRARLGNPNTGIPEVVVWVQYDIYAAAAGSAMGKLTLFTVPQGQNFNFNGVTSFAKGPGHSTLVQAGMLESSYTFVVRAVSFFMQALQGSAHPLLHPEDAINLSSSFLQFRINKKPYLECLPVWLPGGGGIVDQGFGSLTAPASTFNATNGWPDTDNVYALPGGQFINPQEAFDCIIDPTQNAGGTPTALAAAGNPTGVAAAGVMAWFRLDGTLTRVAQ